MMGVPPGPGSGSDGERPVLHVGLNTRVGKLASDKTLGIEDGVGSVHGRLGLGGISNESLGGRVQLSAATNSLESAKQAASTAQEALDSVSQLVFREMDRFSS